MTPAKLEKIMRPNFVWDHTPDAKPLQTNEVIEGSKDFGRTLFVGMSDMFGIQMQDVMSHLDMGYDSYRHKLMLFRGYIKQVTERRAKKTLMEINDNVRKFHTKMTLCMNCIHIDDQRKRYVNLTDWS